MTDKIKNKEKSDAIKRIEKILSEFEDALKIAENVYEDAVEKGDLKLQKEIQKKIDHIKREEASIQNILLGIKTICQ